MQDFCYPETKFGGFTDIDGTITFFNRVNSLLEPGFIVLDVGCGRGAYSEDPISFRKNLRILKGKVARVIGIDVDEGAQENPFLDEFKLIDGDSWPIEDDAVDLVLCNAVLEHVAEPVRFFAEIRRVLKYGGYLCVRTPNRWSYVAFIAKFIPSKFHSKVTSLVQKNRKGEDVFPTHYRCNSIRRLRGIMKANDFEYVVYGHEAEPSYLSFSKVAYFLGVLHQKFAPGFLSPVIFAFGKLKKD